MEPKLKGVRFLVDGGEASDVCMPSTLFTTAMWHGVRERDDEDNVQTLAWADTSTKHVFSMVESLLNHDASEVSFSISQSDLDLENNEVQVMLYKGDELTWRQWKQTEILILNVNVQVRKHAAKKARHFRAMPQDSGVVHFVANEHKPRRKATSSKQKCADCYKDHMDANGHDAVAATDAMDRLYGLKVKTEKLRNKFACVTDKRALLAPNLWFCGFCAAEPEAERDSRKKLVKVIPQLCKVSQIKAHLDTHCEGLSTVFEGRSLSQPIRTPPFLPTPLVPDLVKDFGLRESEILPMPGDGRSSAAQALTPTAADAATAAAHTE